MAVDSATFGEIAIATPLSVTPWIIALQLLRGEKRNRLYKVIGIAHIFGLSVVSITYLLILSIAGEGQGRTIISEWGPKFWLRAFESTLITSSLIGTWMAARISSKIMRDSIPTANRDPPHEGEDGGIFTPPKKDLLVLAACLMLFLAGTIWFFWLAFADPSIRSPIGVAMFGCFFGALTIRTVVGLLAYPRSRVLTSDFEVQVVGLFRTRTVVLANVTRAVWRHWPTGGSLVLRGPAGRVVIQFVDYAGGRELARFFRRTLRPEIQQGFERFERWLVTDTPDVRG
jgi:hypothetical protein